MLFSKDWFEKWQPILLWLSNAPILSIWFRWILCINGNKSSIGKQSIKGILPNAVIWEKDGKNYWEFRTHDKFAKRLFYAFKPFWYLVHLWDTLLANNLVPQWNLGFDTYGPYYPDASSGGTTVDGHVVRESVNESFASIRSGAGSGADTTAATMDTQLVSSGTTDQYQQMRKSVFTFDTSAIPDAATISTAVLSTYGAGKLNDHGGTMDIGIVTVTLTANNNLQSSDYNIANWGSTNFASIAYASLSTSGYNDFSFNASGIAAVSKTGVTALGSRFKTWDIDNGYDGTWTAINTQTVYYCQTADTGGTSQDPKLVITTPTSLVDDYAYFI